MATALLEKQKDEAAQGEADAVPYLWTVERFYRAADADVFDDPSRLELIQGRILEKMPTSPLHTTISYDIAERLREVADTDFLVREERAVRLRLDTELIPAIALVRGKSSDYREQHPTPENVVLLVEVSVTSADYDLGEKAIQYAQAGISEYWVVLAKERTVVVHREPSPEGYKKVTRLSGQDKLSLAGLPEVVWTVDILLAKE